MSDRNTGPNQSPPLPSRPEMQGERSAAGDGAMRLGELLVASGVIEQAALDRALSVQQMGGGRIGTILVNLKICDEAQIRSALEQQLGIEVVDLSQRDPDAAVLDLLSLEAVRKYEVIPLRKDGDELWLAMVDPYHPVVIQEMRALTGFDRLKVTSCTEGDFNRFVAKRLETQTLVQEILAEGDFYQKAITSVDVDDDRRTPQGGPTRELTIESNQPPVITFCNFLLVEAIRRRASDVHLEPYESFVRVRLRVDGRLHALLQPPRRLHAPMVSRLKIMADMDIATRFTPQDGHISVVHGGQTFHFRVSTLPTVHGEKCVIRLLEREHSLSSLEALGMDGQENAFVSGAFRSTQGMILATGPTGSGKTTTLHAGLSMINGQAINIVTLEDPVESTIPGINHVQIHEKAGLSFASGLRSVLRQDPDVVLVGEMRDAEVAGIAVKASLTGHLVLSTLHTNSAIESLVRLDDMGIPPYLVADSLLTIVAQRLLRRVCAECAEPWQPDGEECRALGADLVTNDLRRGRGCKECLNSGYRGRVAVYEILPLNDMIRKRIRRRSPSDEVMAAAKEAGMRTLYEAGLRKVAQGHTTLDEVRRVLGSGALLRS